MKNEKRIVLSISSLIIFLFAVVKISFAQTCSNQSDCENLIKQYADQITKLQGQSKTLKNQIAQFDAQIKLTTLKIAQTEDQIGLLGGRIGQLEESLNSLTQAFSSRAVETYKLSRFENNFSFILSAGDVSDAVNRFHYLQKIQEQDRSLLSQLQEAQMLYKNQKQSQEDLQKQLKVQQTNLNSQKVAKNNLLKVTQNDESKYQSLLSQAQAQLNAFKNFVQSQGGASILSNQTKCGSWGCYYNQRDSSWGNRGIGLSSTSMADAGCLVTSVAMIAKHYGKNVNPGDIASRVEAFYSNTAYMNDSWAVSGFMGATRSKYSASSGKIDSELSAGRPVIVGLYGSFSAPQHFIVIKGKDDRGYIMEDPFMENGGGDNGDGRPLTDKYSVSNIVRVDVVSIN